MKNEIFLEELQKIINETKEEILSLEEMIDNTYSIDKVDE